MKRIILILILAFFAFLVPSQERAFAEGGIAWPESMPVSEAPETQWNIRMVPDGFDGAIIVWQDYRDGNWDIYAQRINENGVAQWTPYGVAVCTAPMNQINPVIVGDGEGGAFIAWEDYRDVKPNIYALRINSAGNPPLGWTGNERFLKLTSTDDQSYPDIVSNGFNKAIIVWQEDNGSQYSIYAHGINGNGSNMWVGGSVVVSSGTAYKQYPKIIRSDSNNVIVTWQDKRSVDYDIYAHRIDILSGAVASTWEVNGSTVTIALGDQLEPQIVADGLGGAIITWTDYRNGNGDIYAQRIDSNGDPATGWTPDGVPICTKDEPQSNPVITEDLLNGATIGAIIAWVDMRDDPSGDIYAKKVARDDPPVLDEEDTFVAGGFGFQRSPRIVSDNLGGAIGAWIEDSVATKDEIFAQKRDNEGNKVWTSPEEVLVCEATEIWDSQIISDGSGGAIIAWVGGDASGDYNIYAQRVVEGAAIEETASIAGIVLSFFEGGGITGVEVEALKDDELVSSDITNTYGYYEITGLIPGTIYEVRATWTVDGIESSVSMDATAPSSLLFFTLEVYYVLGTISGNVSGVEKKYIAGLSCPQSKRISGSGLQEILSPGNGIAFVELEQRDKVIVRVPVEMDGNYSIPNLLPGRFIARAYNGTIYSKPRTVNLKEGETFKVNFVFGIMPGETVFSYPNPAKSGSTTIRYYCGYSDPEAEIKIYNIAGELVRKVTDSEIDDTDAPIYKFLWDCKNSSGKEVASSVYIYIVEVRDKSGSGSKKVVKRLAVIR